MPAIQIHQLTHKFGSTTALNDISFEVQDKSFAVVVGCSGAGKTTLLRLLSGLEPMQQGKILFAGKDVSSVAVADRGIAMVRQDAALYPQLSVQKNVELSLKSAARRKRTTQPATKAMEALEALKITNLADHLPSQLSGGEAQRVALARALAVEPNLLLLDEPLSQTDGIHKEAMLDALRVASANTTTIMVSHDPIDTLRLADHLILMHEGQIVQSGSPIEVYERPNCRVAGSLLGHVGMVWLSLAELKGEVESKTFDQAAAEFGNAHWVGFRPESARLHEDDSEDGLNLELTNVAIQRLGFAQLVSGAIGGQLVRVLISNTQVVPSEKCSIFVPLTVLRWCES